MFATSSLLGGTIKLWDATTFQVITTLTGHIGCIQRIALSPDATLLAASGGSGTAMPSPTNRTGIVSIWNLSADRTSPIAQFAAHPDSAVAVAFSPDGTTLATTGRDGKFHLWEVEKLVKYGTGNGDSTRPPSTPSQPRNEKDTPS